MVLRDLFTSLRLLHLYDAAEMYADSADVNKQLQTSRTDRFKHIIIIVITDMHS